MKSLLVKPLTVFLVIMALTVCQIVNGIFPFLRTEYVSRYLNHLYLSYSEENPDSFTAGPTPNFVYKNSKVNACYSQHLRM